MIHLIIILHFASITTGVVTLCLTWLHFIQQRDEIHKWLFHTYLALSIVMILDTLRIYLGKNVQPLPFYTWSIFEILVYLFGTIIIFTSIKLISATTKKTIPQKLFLIVISAFLIFVVTDILDNVFHFSFLYLVIPFCFCFMLFCFTVYGLLSIKLASMQYRPITIAYTVVMSIYSIIYSLTSLFPGIPDWIKRFPYYQITYLSLGILGMLYLFTRGPVLPILLPNSTHNGNEDHLTVLSERFGLTEREIEIISEVVKGRNNKEISKKLFISPSTVKNHIYNIYKKMGIRNRFELMALIPKNH